MDNSLRFFPVGLFSSIMGLCGLSIAYQRFEQAFELRLGIGFSLLIVACIVFLLVSFAYAAKLINHRADAINEFNHPVKASFFPAISISLLLLSIGMLDIAKDVAQYLWIAGTGLQFIFTVTIMSRWINRSYEIVHSNPSWFLPVVGNILVPVAGVEFAHRELAWFFFSIGAFFGSVLFTIIFYRLTFHSQLPAKLMSTLFILVAPPAVGFVAYTKLTGEMDNLARVLLYVAIFLVVILLSMARNFTGISFFVSWWAYTFPMCAVTIAATMAFKFTGLTVFGWIAAFLLALTTSIIAVVTVKTIQAFWQNAICVED